MQIFACELYLKNVNEKDYCTCCEVSSLLMWQHYETGGDRVRLVRTGKKLTVLSVSSYYNSSVL